MSWPIYDTFYLIFSFIHQAVQKKIVYISYDMYMHVKIAELKSDDSHLMLSIIFSKK